MIIAGKPTMVSRDTCPKKNRRIYRTYEARMIWYRAPLLPWPFLLSA